MQDVEEGVESYGRFRPEGKRTYTEEWMRTFCIITTAANELVGRIHDRMPVILPPDAYDRWLANIEPKNRRMIDAILDTIEHLSGPL